MAIPFVHRSKRRNKENVTWRERVAALRYIPSLVKLVWQTHRGYTLAIAAFRIFNAFNPVILLWVAKMIIDTVVAGQKTGPDYPRLSKFVALESTLVTLVEVISRGSVLFESLLGDLFSNYRSVRLMKHAATLDLYHFETPDFYD